METFKKYLPWIIGGAVLIFVLTRLKTNLVPQTSLVQTPQSDAYAQDRATAFQSLIGLAGIQTQADITREENAMTQSLASRAQEIQRELGLKSFEIDSERIEAAYQTALRASNNALLQREQDRQLQQNAIDRAYSSQTTQQILGSINTALSGIFGNRGSNKTIFGTPPTFPSGGFF